jgi:hypothetical protein
MHEVMDPVENIDLFTPKELETKKYLQSFYYGITLYLIISTQLLIIINYMYSMAMIVIYSVTVSYHIYHDPLHR